MSELSSRVPAYKDALVDVLRSRPAWQSLGVQVLSEPPGDDAALTHFWLTEEASARKWTNTGRPSLLGETGSLGFELIAVSSEVGETGSRAARDAVYALLADLDKLLAQDPGLGQVVMWSRVETVQGVWGTPVKRELGGRSHKLTGTITFESRLTPGG